MRSQAQQLETGLIKKTKQNKNKTDLKERNKGGVRLPLVKFQVVSKELGLKQKQIISVFYMPEVGDRQPHLGSCRENLRTMHQQSVEPKTENLDEGWHRYQHDRRFHITDPTPLKP